jgi:hypothetical protein
MGARELAEHFNKRIAAAIIEKDKQLSLAEEHSEKRSDDVEHCKRQLETLVIPFFADAKDSHCHGPLQQTNAGGNVARACHQQFS